MLPNPFGAVSSSSVKTARTRRNCMEKRETIHKATYSPPPTHCSLLTTYYSLLTYAGTIDLTCCTKLDKICRPAVEDFSG